MGNGVVDNLAHPGTVLRVHLAKQFLKVLCVVLALSKDDGFSNQRPSFILDAIINQVFQDDPIGVLTEYLSAYVFASDGGGPGFFFTQIFFKLLLLIRGQIAVVNAFTEEFGRQIFCSERHQIGRLIVDRRIQPEFERGVGGFTIEDIEGVTADELDRCCG